MTDKFEWHTEPFYVIFDGPPSHESGRFVEVETEAGKSVSTKSGWSRVGAYYRLGPFVEAADNAKLREQVEKLAEALSGLRQEINHLVEDGTLELDDVKDHPAITRADTALAALEPKP